MEGLLGSDYSQEMIIDVIVMVYSINCWILRILKVFL